MVLGVERSGQRILDSKEWPKAIKGETLALVVEDKGDFDFAHLRLIKEGTLVFVLAHQVLPLEPPVRFVPQAPQASVVPSLPALPPVPAVVGPLPPPRRAHSKVLPSHSYADSLGKMAIHIFYESRVPANKNKTLENCALYTNVEVFRVPAEDADAKMDPDRLTKDGLYMRCDVLKVFTENSTFKDTQIMTAEGNVFFRTQEFFGNAAIVKYGDLHDTIFEGTPENPATLYRKQPGLTANQEIKGCQNQNNRKTGVFQIIQLLKGR